MKELIIKNKKEEFCIDSNETFTINDVLDVLKKAKILDGLKIISFRKINCKIEIICETKYLEYNLNVLINKYEYLEDIISIYIRKMKDISIIEIE